MRNNNERHSVLHIDRNQLFREGLSRILSDSPFTVKGEASSLTDGMDLIPALNPGLIIIDPSGYGDALPGLMTTVESASPKPRVVVLTDSVGIAGLASALDTGVGGYLLKNMSTDALKQSLNLVVIGETVFPTDLAYLLINNRFIACPDDAPVGRAGGLSGRETEILSCLVNGLANKEIANHLNITEGTVKVHLKGILKKINVHNRTQAAIWAVQNGIAADITVGVPIERTPASGLRPRSAPAVEA